MINLEKTVQEIIDYFHPTLRDDVEDLEKDYLTRVSAVLTFCTQVELEWEQCRGEEDAVKSLRVLANKARDFLAEEGR